MAGNTLETWSSHLCGMIATLPRTTPFFATRMRPPAPQPPLPTPRSDRHRHRSRWRTRLVATACALALLCPAALPPAWAQNQLPALGDPASEDFSIATERKLGDAIMREIRADPDYLDDPVLLEYLESLWQPLVAQARVRGNISPDVDQRLAWEPFLVRDRSVNAFALPGGYVGDRKSVV